MSPEDVVTVADIARILKLNSQTVRNLDRGRVFCLRCTSGDGSGCAGAMSRR